MIDQHTLVCSERRIFADHGELYTQQSYGILALSATSAAAPAAAKNILPVNAQVRGDHASFALFPGSNRGYGTAVVLAHIKKLEGMLAQKG